MIIYKEIKVKKNTLYDIQLVKYDLLKTKSSWEVGSGTRAMFWSGKATPSFQT